MNITRVLIVNSRSLLMEGIESLLGANGHFTVVSTPAGNFADLNREIKHLQPNIVIIDEAMTFVKPAHLIASMSGNLKIRLIVINSRTSRIDIYDKSELVVPTLDHFLDVIKREMAQNLLR